jgi:hypothetical protein
MNLSDDGIDESEKIYINQTILNLTENYSSKKKKQRKLPELNLNEKIFKSESKCPNCTKTKRQKYLIVH